MVVPQGDAVHAECTTRGTSFSQPLHKQLHQSQVERPPAHTRNHSHDQSTRTSLTLSDSWADTWFAPETTLSPAGVDIPALLRPLFGVDFLPLPSPTTTIPEEEVPRSVEIAEEEEPEIVVPPETPPFPADNDCEVSVVSCLHQVAPLQETKELQQLILDHQQHQRTKKRKAGKRLKAAARAVFHRVSSAKKNSSKNSVKHPPEAKELTVETVVPSPISALSSFDQHDWHGKWITPTVTATTEAIISPLSGPNCTSNVNAGNEQKMIHEQAQCLRQQAEKQERHVQETHNEIETLQSKLAESIARYQSQLACLQETQKKLEQLALQSSSSPTVKIEDLKEEDFIPAHYGKPPLIKRSESGSFMRVHDLDLLGRSSRPALSRDPSMSSLSHSGHSAQAPPLSMAVQSEKTPEFLLMDHYLLEIVQSLNQVGFQLATDEGGRYTPTKETAKIISQIPASAHAKKDGWPVHPWTPAFDHHILVWSGFVSHEGFGHAWPVVKGRAILHTSARHALEYLWDSNLVPKYNPMCQGRDDIYILQDDVNVKAEESPYGFAGCAKIVRSLNKHSLVPKAIEMKALLHARPLEQHKGSYMLVSRSVWENETATLDTKAAKSVIRTEMLLGCTIMRALDENTCEMTQVSHIHSPGVPVMVAKRAAPGQCLNLMKALQSLFPPRS